MINDTYILNGSSSSRLGVLDLIIGCLYRHECYAYEIHTFDDNDIERFFFRVEFRYVGIAEFDEQSLRHHFEQGAMVFDAEWDLRDTRRPIN